MFSSQVYSSWKELQEEKYKAILENFPQLFLGNILDIGSGSGYLEKFLADHDITAKIVCVDIEKMAGIIADGGKLPFKDNAFDAVISIDAMHLVKGKDFARVLKKCGFALLALFFNSENYEERKELLKAKLHGFEIIKEFEICGKENEYIIFARKLHPF